MATGEDQSEDREPEEEAGEHLNGSSEEDRDYKRPSHQEAEDRRREINFQAQETQAGRLADRSSLAEEVSWKAEEQFGSASLQEEGGESEEGDSGRAIYERTYQS